MIAHRRWRVLRHGANSFSVSAYRILAVCDPHNPLERAVLGGAAAWMQRHRPAWQVDLRLLTATAAGAALRAWRGDGALCTQRRSWRGSWAKRLPYPCINTLGLVERPQLPSVLGDDAAIGRTCAEHLLERGYRRLEILGRGARGFVHRRMAGALERARQAGAASRVRIWRDDFAPTPAEEPVGYICSEDSLARDCLQALARVGVAVPEAAAVVGINNDVLCCGLHRPTISSCDLACERRGWEAAALLDRLLAGAAPPTTPLRLPPRGVVQRASTAALAAGDPVLERTWRFLRAAAERPVNVAELVRASGVSRRGLENRVRTRLGFGLQEAIWRAHVARAKELLQDPECSDNLLGIALASGFVSASAFATIFKRHTGTSPREWRRRWS